MVDERAYAAWLEALGALTGTPAQAQGFQEHRFRFAHRLRTALLADERLGAEPLLYGVELETAGWVYVGQTQNGQRRLRDLPIGESHHLANTFPPELWNRVVVLYWPILTADISLPGGKATGIALERLLQRHVRPLFNCRRKGSGGEWRIVNFDPPAQRAEADPAVQALWRRIVPVWDALAACPMDAPAHVPAGRVIFPRRL